MKRMSEIIIMRIMEICAVVETGRDSLEGLGLLGNLARLISQGNHAKPALTVAKSSAKYGSNGIVTVLFAGKRIRSCTSDVGSGSLFVRRAAIVVGIDL